MMLQILKVLNLVIWFLFYSLMVCLEMSARGSTHVSCNLCLIAGHRDLGHLADSQG